MSEDRRTKAQLVEALNKANRDLLDAERRIPSAPSPVPAASALAGCIRALDPLVKRDSYGHGPASAEVEQVIRYLVGRYRLDLAENWMDGERLPKFGPDGEREALATDVQELLAEADALVESWDRKGSWSSDSPVGLVMRLARALRAAAETGGEHRAS